MANGGNRPIAPVRKLIGAVLATVAGFVILFGLGMTSWAIVALGVAVLVLAIALATVRGGGRTWVIGEGTVHSASEPPTQYAFGRCELQLVIDAPGLPPRSKKIIEPRVPVAKWPSLGQSLPIRVALDDQRHVRVLWDEVPTHAETAAAVADLPPEYAGPDPVDEMLIAQEAPPWAGRAPDDDLRDPLAPDPLDDDRGFPSGEREPVVLHQRPGEPVVLEGTLVEPGVGGPLPRRATPTPRSPAEEHFDPPTSGFAPSAPADPFDPPTERADPSDQSGTDRAEPSPPRDPFARSADSFAPSTGPADPFAPSTGPADPFEPTADRLEGTPGDRRPDPTVPVETIDADPGAEPAAARRFRVPAPSDPLDPLDLPLDDPAPPRGTRPGDGASAEDLDAVIFGTTQAGTAPAGAGTTDPPIAGVGVTLLVTDLTRSLRFYQDLGFTEVDRGSGNAVLASGATRLVLREITEAVPVSRRLVHVNLEVDDIESAYDRLRGSGVRFTYAPRVVNRGTRLEVWAAAFRDPDGHGIALTQWRERADA
ncbi:VOC family protein [Micromonospora endolithica]|uniref:Glyoxalase/bleomycin resistance/dioxygenase family protein n=1 Tax=Micromonospora endolithica TaxID=230091 RepID=A0A3A9Z2U5_9ACTN|nr:VOC family protein [Micromonospora endolithica]RKN42618.1 glyoxalase/bleomycin resistance/dioxygenase family protein [Micromonospora endolithica]TWJ19989.1 glyoxalase/bleomycin resistance protein/dioxygenase superfamily protein [Micromonospora endolithica]